MKWRTMQMPLQTARVDKMMDSMTTRGTSHAWRTWSRRRAKMTGCGVGKEGKTACGRESRKGRERLSEVVGGRGFLACSLDMGQEINGTSNTDANSVNQAAQRPTSIMSCSVCADVHHQQSKQDLVLRSVNHWICTSLNRAATWTINQSAGPRRYSL